MFEMVAPHRVFVRRELIFAEYTQAKVLERVACHGRVDLDDVDTAVGCTTDERVRVFDEAECHYSGSRTVSMGLSGLVRGIPF